MPPKNPKKDLFYPPHIAVQLGPKAGINNNYSLKQVKIAKILMEIDSSNDQEQPDFANWSNANIPAYQSEETRNITLNRININPEHVFLLKHHRHNTELSNGEIEYTSPYLPVDEMKVHHRYLLHNVLNDLKPCSITLKAINASIILAETYYRNYIRVQSYSRYDFDTSIMPIQFIHQVRPTIKDNQERNNVYTSLFGWHRNKNSTRHQHITGPSVHWMHLMYSIGATLLQACIELPDCEKRPTIKDYMTFNPYTNKDGELMPYYTTRNKGSYWSQTVDVSEYEAVLIKLQEVVSYGTIANNSMFVDTVIHAVIFDFMAFTAQTLGTYKDNDKRKIGWLRDGLLFDIDQLLDPAFTHHGIKTTFQLIVRISRPVIDTIKVPLTGKVTRRVDEQIRLFNLKNTQEQNEIENYPELVPHLREREIWEATRHDARQHVVHESRLPWTPPTPPPEDIPSPPRHSPRVLTEEEIEMELFIRAGSGADEIPLDKLFRGPDETDDHHDMRIRKIILKDFPIHTAETG